MIKAVKDGSIKLIEYLKKNAKTKEVILSYLLTSICLLLTVWYAYNNHNIIINKKYLLKKSVKNYSDLIAVGLYKDAFDKFLTSEAKNKIHYENRQTAESIRHCASPNNTRPLTFRIECAIPPTEKYEVSALSKFNDYAITRNQKYREIKILKIITNGNRADIAIGFKVNGKDGTYVENETWLFEKGGWLRDF